LSSYLPKQPYIVLDQNPCRKRAVMAALFRRCRENKLGILLPDTAIYEFSKGSQAYDTWRRSLEHLCTQPELVFAGRSLGKMMAHEISTGQPLQDVVDHEVTLQFRQMLSGLQVGNDARMKRALSKIARIIDTEKALRERHDENKSIVLKLRDHWKKSLPDADLKSLRNDNRETFVRILAELETAAIVFEAAKHDGCTDASASVLTLGPSVYGHVVLGLAALALDWLAQGGIDGIAPEKITNDYHDLDYICTASFCTDLVTEDRRANRIYSGMIEALERRWQCVTLLAQKKQVMAKKATRKAAKKTGKKSAKKKVAKKKAGRKTAKK